MLLKILYIALNLLVLALLLNLGFKTVQRTFTDSTKAKKKKSALLLVLLLWQIYMAVMASTGLFLEYTFPPKFALFLILPAFILSGYFIYKNRKSAWIMNIPPQHLLLIQSYRILIELLFVVSLGYGLLHENVTIEGYNFDLVYASTIPFIVYLVFTKKAFPKSLAVVWNYLGLLVIASIIFVFMSTIYFPHIYVGDTVLKDPLMGLEFTKYPYIVVAGFLMPTAVFLHLLSLVQLSRLKMEA